MTRDDSSPSPGSRPAFDGAPLAGQAELDALRQDQSGTCWWCGRVADSREHRHKASLLRRMWGEEGVYLSQEGRELYKVPGVKSGAVKFSKILCQRCNNTRSQPFDNAYDVYAEYVQTNGARMRRATLLDWRTIYGPGWKDSTLMLGSYAVKNFGCWIAEGGFAPPAAFAHFLDGGELRDTSLTMARNGFLSLVYRAMELDGAPWSNHGTGLSPEFVEISPERKRLTSYESYSYISDICTWVRWRDGAGKGEVFWDSPIAPLDIMPANARQRVFAARIGVRALGRRAWRHLNVRS